jgi:predicted PhzF superfamily epimerase YddE/YHI9
VVQECAKGLVPLRVDAQGALAFAAPPSLRRPITEEQLAPVLRALGLERGDVRACQQLDNGPNFWALLLDDPDRLLALQPDLATLHALGVEVGLAALYPRAPVALIGRAGRAHSASTARPGGTRVLPHRRHRARRPHHRQLQCQPGAVAAG